MKDDIITKVSHSEPELIELDPVHELTPISIDCKSPPIQYYRIINKTATDLEYEIETESIDLINAQNMNFKVFQILKSAKCIPARGKEYLEILFHPLEEKAYELQLGIVVRNGGRRIITIRGQGILQTSQKGGQYLDRTILDRFTTSTPKLPKSMVSISREILQFGNIPICTTNRKVVVISNSSKKDTIAISWNIPPIWPKNAIKITPQTKMLQPGQSQVFKITFCPDETPRCFNFDIECIVANETKLKENKAAEEQRLQESKPYFQNAESIPLNLIKKSNRSLRGKITIVEDKKKSITKYKPLPSIISRKMELYNGEMPEPVVRVVTIQARSHTTEEFKSTYGNLDMFYREKRSGYVNSHADTTDSPLWKQQDFVTAMMMTLLKDVFNEEEIQSMPDKVCTESLPYFRSLSEASTDPRNAELYTNLEILSSADFMNATEAALEGTLYNLIQEIEMGEFDCTTYPNLILKHILP